MSHHHIDSTIHGAAGCKPQENSTAKRGSLGSWAKYQITHRLSTSTNAYRILQEQRLIQGNFYQTKVLNPQELR
jgi:hypothetical protein